MGKTGGGRGTNQYQVQGSSKINTPNVAIPNMAAPTTGSAVSAFTAQDVQILRHQTGAGMMDAKRALEAVNGNFPAAVAHLRASGAANSVNYQNRPATQGVIAISNLGNVATLAQIQCQTVECAKTDAVVAMATQVADLAVQQGTGGLAGSVAPALSQLMATHKENISLGMAQRFDAPAGRVLGSYLHTQNGRGVNGVLVQLDGGDKQLAHDLAVHIAFAKPQYLSRADVPATEVAAELTMVTAQCNATGKPPAAVANMIQGRMNAFYAQRVLLDQPYVKDEKRTVGQMLGVIQVVRFAQVVIDA